ncbi:cytochrome c [Steroidobacter sp.]|uniref:cytochrome c n=1 Tax=Steroidobacter sp. TaxID=1978227 RepID=UPI001A464D5E|nr:cytochrome c [Steroidobacter sp.]MBL8271350.1 cytochrome c [Steroidobacter sp.]
MATLIAGSLLQAGCSDRSPAPAAAAVDAPASATFDTSIDTRQLMSWVVDPSSKVVFGAVASIVTEKGEEEIQPRTDDEWNNARNHAAVLIEAGNSLMLAGRARNPKIQDQQDWNAKARAMSAAARVAIEATDVKDAEALFAASGDIYQTCTDCHAKYIFTPEPSAAQ